VSRRVLPVSGDSSRGAAALEIAAEFGQGSLKISLLLHRSTDPGGDDWSPDAVSINVSRTTKTVKGQCTFLPWVPLQHRAKNLFWHLDASCCLPVWYGSIVACFILFSAYCWQISEGRIFCLYFTLWQHLPNLAVYGGCCKNNQTEIWHTRSLCFTSEKHLGAVKAEHGQQPITTPNTLLFALKLWLSLLCLPFNLPPTPWHRQWLEIEEGSLNKMTFSRLPFICQKPLTVNKIMEWFG